MPNVRKPIVLLKAAFAGAILAAASFAVHAQSATVFNHVIAEVKK